MRYLSLFSGIGGFELGIIKAHENLSITKRKKQRRNEKNSSNNEQKFLATQQPTCIGFSEINKYAIKIYEKHFPKHKNYGDITKIIIQELPDFDLLVGGFPCQAFSVAGKRKGFDDTRGTLFFDIARILKEKQPRNFILENVKGLLSHDNGRTFKTIISTLVELGYCVEWQVLNAKNFGVPQNRERVFIVGHFGRIPERKVFPIGTGNEKNDLQINILGHKDVYRRANQVFDPKGIIETLSTCGGGGQHPCTVSKTIRSGGRSSPHGSKQNWDSYEFDGRIRRLTPIECERLMAYPDGWTEGLSDTQRYKTLGNGIVSNVVAEVVKKLL